MKYLDFQAFYRFPSGTRKAERAIFQTIFTLGIPFCCASAPLSVTNGTVFSWRFALLMAKQWKGKMVINYQKNSKN